MQCEDTHTSGKCLEGVQMSFSLVDWLVMASKVRMAL